MTSPPRLRSLLQGLQSVRGGRGPKPAAAADVGGLGPGRGGAEAGAAHAEMLPGRAAYERDAKQPKISFKKNGGIAGIEHWLLKMLVK